MDAQFGRRWFAARTPERHVLAGRLFCDAADRAFGAFCEDGVIIADATCAGHWPNVPESVATFQARRKFMIDQLGIALSDDVLRYPIFQAQ